MSNHEDYELLTNDGGTARGVAVISLNLWAMPFGSSAVCSRPGHAASAAYDTANADAAAMNPPPMIVICFQEAWSFRCGLAWPLLALARCIERTDRTSRPRALDEKRSILAQLLALNHPFTLAAQIAAAITIPLFPFAWWSGAKADAIRRIGPGFSSVGKGVSRGRGLMDSGLLIVSNVKPCASGFVAFSENGGLLR
jgi:hypothetical protein